MRIYNSIMGAVVIIAIFVSYHLYTFETVADKVNFVVTVLSLVISLLAFIVAVKTYSSIDSVNIVSQMEGNVLENKNYVTSLTEILRRYDADNSKDLRDKIFSDLTIRFKKKSQTAIAFSNNLQYFIDLIVIYPLLFKSETEKKENMQKMENLLKLIDKRKDELISVSLGNLTLIEETVKLIKAVMHYQQLIHNDNFNLSSSLLEVRGNMLVNSVSKTIYYNYLGLFYNKKAMQVIRKGLNLKEKDTLSIAGLTELYSKLGTKLSEEEEELISLYLKESKRAFEKALENSREDKMWAGFIKYNDARTTFFLHLFFPDKKTVEWKRLLDEAIIARKQLNILNQNFLGEKVTYIQEEFIYQEYLARLVKMNIFIAKGEDICDTMGQILYEAPSYVGLLEDRYIAEDYMGPSERIREYQREIRKAGNNLFVNV